MTRWSALADSTLAWPAVRWLDHPNEFSDAPAFAFLTSAAPAATANAMSPTTAPARDVLASLLFIWKVPLLRHEPGPLRPRLSLNDKVRSGTGAE